MIIFIRQDKQEGGGWWFDEINTIANRRSVEVTRAVSYFARILAG